MTPHIHLDFETFSKADLKAVGAYRYAFDPSTEILCAAVAFGDDEPVAWSCVDGWENTKAGMAVIDGLLDPSVLVYAHNAMFEMAICQALLEKTWGVPCPDLSRFRCTASLARRAAMPAKLEKLAEALALPGLKDKRGVSLIRKFSVMQPGRRVSKKHLEGSPPFRLLPQDDPAAFAEFIDYCKQDVRVEQMVSKKLAYFGDELNERNYSIDARINARGVTVNLDALRKAQALVDEEFTVLADKFRSLTGFEITQNARLLAWLHEQGVHLDNLQAETLETFMYGRETDTSPAVEALRCKQLTSFASIKKIPTMLECAGPHDNHIRGMLNYHGATTGRWTASLVQFQNMRRPTIKDSDAAYREICEGISRGMIDCVYGAPIDVIGSCIRHFVDPGGDGFFDADYAAIEARIVNWLAGQEDALEEYRQGVDRYKVMAGLIYGIPASSVNKHPQRFVGKTAVLGAGFGLGAAKFRDSCAKYGCILPPGLEFKAIEAFRAKHDKVVKFWYATERAAKRAILKKNEIIKVNRISFLHKDIEGLPFLLLKLPSGRNLAYPRPRIQNDRITHYGHVVGVNWGDVETYGGRLVENLTQAVAADIMANGAYNAEQAGYEIATLIHDQALAYVKPGQTVDEFVRLLTTLPPWAEGLPIEAEGARVPFYRKE